MQIQQKTMTHKLNIVRSGQGELRFKVQTLGNLLEIFALLLLTVGPLNQAINNVVCLILIAVNCKYIAKIKFSVMQILIISFMIFPMIWDVMNVTSDNPYSFAGFSYLRPFVLCVLMIQKYSYRTFVELLERVIFIVSACSIIGMVVLYCMPSILEKLPVLYFYGRPVSTCLIFSAVRNYTGGFLRRNCGMAFEPGAFQFVTNLGMQLFFMLKMGKKGRAIKKVIPVMVYIVATLLTRSTTGIIIMGVLFLINALKSRKNFVITIVICVLFSLAFASQVQFQVKKMETGNFGGRFENSVHVIKNYSGHLFGVGSTGYNSIYKRDPAIGSWDVYTNLYLRYGIPFIILLFVYIAKLRKIDRGIMALVFLTLLTESVLGPVIVMLFYYSEQDRKMLYLDENKIA